MSEVRPDGPEARLRALGLVLPAALALPGANRVAARVWGGLVFVSGHGSDLLEPAPGLMRHGRVPEEVSPEAAHATARAVGLKMLATLRATLGSLDRVGGVIKLTGFVLSSPDFDAMNGVINGASDLMVELFGPAGVHSRSSIGAAALVRRQTVEIEGIFALAD